MLEPIQKVNLGEAAYQHIKDTIIGGGLAPGEVIYEPRLASSLKISRTPVREALIRLEQEGWIAPSPTGGQGFIVKSLDQSDIEEIFEMRILLEARATGYFARMATEDQLANLTDPVEEIEAEIRMGRFNLYFSVHRGLHQVVVTNCPNVIMRETLMGLNERMVRVRNFTGYDPNRHVQFSFAEQGQIVNALVERDAHAAERSMARHLEASRERVIEQLRESGPLASADQ